MIEFVEECRREWKRLGVPDPIANEMALDLTADIDEAVADGGSAEDVLGNSLFDPRRFAAAWASARGVTAPPVPVDPFPPAALNRSSWYRPAMIATVSLLGFFFALAAAALVIGRHGVAVAATVERRVSFPRPARIFGPTVHLISGPSFPIGPFVALAFVLLLVGFVVLSLAIVYRALGPDRSSRRRFW
jgi:hypothetical protein